MGIIEIELELAMI